MADEAATLENQPAAGEQPFVMKDNEYYMTSGPNGEPCVIMTRETWLTYGTQLEGYRRNAILLEARVKELAEESKSRGEALEALRDVRRKEKRVDIEGGLLLPGSRDFTKRK